jgi:hypothetical protein
MLGMLIEILGFYAVCEDYKYDLFTRDVLDTSTNIILSSISCTLYLQPTYSLSLSISQDARLHSRSRSIPARCSLGLAK